MYGNIFAAESPAPGRICPFAGWGGFAPGNAAVKDILDLFWEQFHRIDPESYIADGDSHLTFISRHKNLVDIAYDRLATPSEPR